MSIEVFFSCVLQGESFDPSPLLSGHGIVVKTYHCVGDYGTRGRYKNKSYPDGYIYFTCDKTKDLLDFLMMLNTPELRRVLDTADHRELSVNLEYRDQCNWELSIDEIREIHNLGLILTVSCYTEDE